MVNSQALRNLGVVYTFFAQSMVAGIEPVILPEQPRRCEWVPIDT